MKNYLSPLIFHLSSRKGFTLIELLVAVAIIGILAGSVFFLLNPAEQFQRAQDAKRKSDLAQIQKGLELYYQDNGSYPEASNFHITDSGESVAWGSSWQPYMSTLPKDPSSPLKKYAYNSDGQTYYLYASLDRSADPQACNDGNVCTSIELNPYACGEDICNIGVSSPNVSVSEIASIDVPIPPTPTPKPSQTPIQTNYSGFAGWSTSNLTLGYRFTPLKNGKITALWDYSYGGSKTLKLWSDNGDGTGTLLNQVTVTGNNIWVEGKLIQQTRVYKDKNYVVTTYLVLPGGYYKASITPSLPYNFADIRILVAVLLSGDNFPATDRPSYLLGIPDITFIPD